MFKDKLYDIMSELNLITEKRYSGSIIEKKISERLDRSLEQYYENLEGTIKYLLSKNNITVLKGIMQTLGKEE